MAVLIYSFASTKSTSFFIVVYSFLMQFPWIYPTWYICGTFLSTEHLFFYLASIFRCVIRHYCTTLYSNPSIKNYKKEIVKINRKKVNVVKSIKCIKYWGYFKKYWVQLIPFVLYFLQYWHNFFVISVTCKFQQYNSCDHF